MKNQNEKTFTVFVDGEELKVPRKDLTAKELLELAGLNSEERYLIAQFGSNPISYKDKINNIIQGLHQKMEFFTASLCAVTVS